MRAIHAFLISLFVLGQVAMGAENYVGNYNTFGGATIVGADAIVAFPFQVTQSVSVLRMGIVTKPWISASPSGMLAIYSDASGNPDALVTSTANFDVSNGRLEVPTTQVTLTSGTYWFAVQFDSAVAVGSADRPGFDDKEADLDFGTSMPTSLAQTTLISKSTFGAWNVYAVTQ
jgi:hypothetical protein